MRRRSFLATLAAAGASTLAAGCGSGGGSSPSGGASGATTGTVKIAYQKFGNFTQLDDLMKRVKQQFESANAGATLELIPIEAAQNDYITKLALMMRSPATAPDLMYEDTFMIRSDVSAGYLLPLDTYLEKWDDWKLFVEASKAAGKADDGKTYGVSLGTDTRGLWYNRTILEKVGVTGQWQPTSWAELLEMARTVKAKVPDVIPLNLYSGKPMGEASVMQGFEMLLYGAPGGTLYTDDGRWVVGSKQFRDALDFVKTLYGEGLGPTPQQALDTTVGQRVSGEWFPKGQLAMGVDGSWLPGTWLSKGAAPWPQWATVMGWAGMPTQNGQGEGKISMSGGWTLAIGAGSKVPDLAFSVLKLAINRENALANYIDNSQIAVRTDCSDDPAYLGANESVKFFTDLVSVTKFRPATEDYPTISTAIAAAMESVMTGQQSVADAAAAYDKAVVAQVGKDRTVEG